MTIVLSIIGWLLIVFINVRLALRKKRNPWLWGILSVVTTGFSVIWTIVLVILPTKRT